MNWNKISDARTGEAYYEGVHASGLTIQVWPKDGYTSTYAVFGVRYGSVDTSFRRAGDDTVTVVPEGIAHYLEHKLFESEEGDAFARYAETGASANAYTSFDRTAYLFTCTGPLEESLTILLDFVQHPYFTEQTVNKERGIIGQEIRMCEDAPSRRLLFNLLRGLYRNHPVRVDIAGTVESIAHITPELLYDCYNRFYNLHNMVLAVAGQVTLPLVEKVADATLSPAAPWEVRRAPVDEPAEAAIPRTEEHMTVAAPLFYLGYKIPMQTENGLRYLTAREDAALAVLGEIIGGRASRLYADLMKRGLINPSFSIGCFDGPGFACWIIGGESAAPDEAITAIKAEIKRLKKEGIDPTDFEAARRALYGTLLTQTDDVESCGELLANSAIYGRKPFDLLDEVASLAVQSVEEHLNDFREEASAVSLILPQE